MEFSSRIDVEKVKSMTSRLLNRMTNLGSAFGKIAPVIRSSIEMNFSAGGRPRWIPAKKYSGHPLLLDTGKLRAAALAFKLSSGSTKASFVPVLSPGQMVHQFGFSGQVQVNRKGKSFSRKMNIPRRPFFVLHENDRSRIVSIIQSEIMGE